MSGKELGAPDLRPPLHGWELSASEARQLQGRLAERICLTPLQGQPETVAGIDCGIEANGHLRAVVSLFDYPAMNHVQTVIHRQPCVFPYVPGLLSFREMPAVLGAMEQLAQKPDLLLCDGQGIAHPRRLGIASHLGLWLNRPAIGVGKSRLVGCHEDPGQDKGCHTPLMDRGERIGTVLRTRTGVRPVYVSPGHLVDHADSMDWVLGTLSRYRLPEPIRAADRASRGPIPIRPALR